jgi:NNMT/PNMT/TEMT family
MLEYGGGPTIYQLISLANVVSEVHFTDYLAENIKAVQDWVNKEAHAHDWTEHVCVALAKELYRPPTTEEIVEREKKVRSLITRFGHVDAFNPHKDTTRHEYYSLVSANFVAESIAKDRVEWEVGLKSVLKYVEKGGYLVMTAIRNATHWRAGTGHFPGYSLSTSQLVQKLAELGFSIELLREIDADQTNPIHVDYEGYDGMIFVLAKKY